MGGRGQSIKGSEEGKVSTSKASSVGKRVSSVGSVKEGQDYYVTFRKRSYDKSGKARVETVTEKANVFYIGKEFGKTIVYFRTESGSTETWDTVSDVYDIKRK